LKKQIDLLNSETVYFIVGWVEVTKPNKPQSWCWVSLSLNPTYNC